jgi:hypothetical protein
MSVFHTNTLAYPDYNAIVPRIDVAVGSSPINYNNFQLSPTRSKNYDAYFSFYENSIGLFTIGGFLKQIHDFIYSWGFFVSGANSLKYYPPSLVASSIPTINPNIISYINNPYKAEVWGLELDWQTHFWYLPHPFDGLVLNVNTLMFIPKQNIHTQILQGLTHISVFRHLVHRPSLSA